MLLLSECIFTDQTYSDQVIVEVDEPQIQDCNKATPLFEFPCPWLYSD